MNERIRELAEQAGMTTLREAAQMALEQPGQEPVAWMHKETGSLRREISRPKGADWDANYWQPLYATAQPTAEDIATPLEGEEHMSPLLERVLNVLVNRCDPSNPIIKEVREAVESSRIAPEQTLRDFFAAQAMQSLIVTNSETNTMQQLAETSYLLADAMIKERDA